MRICGLLRDLRTSGTDSHNLPKAPPFGSLFAATILDMTTTHLLYLHGFGSSPQSMKARMMAAAMQSQQPDVQWWCPQLPPSPKHAMEMLMEGIANWPNDSLAVVGPSLGGFYIAHVAQHSGCKAVLLTPAIDPEPDLPNTLVSRPVGTTCKSAFSSRNNSCRSCKTCPVAR